MDVRRPFRTPPHLLFVAAAALSLAGCTREMDEATAGTAIGDFRLDRLVVIVDNPITGPVTRTLPDATVQAAVTEAVDERLRRFQGTGSYSIGIKVAGYVLAPPGIPVLFAPRSTLFLSVNAYDDVPSRLHPEPKNMTIFEDAGGDTVVGSGYTQTADEQLVELAENAAVQIERWLRENESWFGGRRARGAPPLPLPVPPPEPAASGTAVPEAAAPAPAAARAAPEPRPAAAPPAPGAAADTASDRPSDSGA